jgi:CAAX prenyl protease-like protein
VHWAARLLGSVVVVPLAEELFVRSCVPRYVDAGDRPWNELPIGRFSPLAVIISLACFTLSHPEWLAALVVGALFTLLLAATGRLRDAVLAHAVANATLAAVVIGTGDTQWW